MFETVFSSSTVSSAVSSTAGSIPVKEFVVCILAALVIGVVLALTYTIKNSCSKGFAVTIALLPAIVAAVIIMVSGNVGAGVAVAGTFSLVRFRSAQGTAKEICEIFLAMATGLIIGMGYIGLAVIFAVIVAGANVFYNVIGFCEKKPDILGKSIKITIPEELDYTNVFDDIFDEYTSKCDLTSVKTTNMGSMYRLSYDVKLKDAMKEKEFIDKLRCRNGNLEIICARTDLKAESDVL